MMTDFDDTQLVRATLRASLGLAKSDSREGLLTAYKQWLRETTLLRSLDQIDELVQELRIALPEYATDTGFLDAIREECVRRRELFDVTPDDHADLYGPALDDNLPRYRLLKQIGKGRQGDVFKAVDRQFANSTNSIVAIKIFRQSGVFEGVRAKSVDHPCVVRVLDQGTDPREGTAFVVYTHVGGPTLNQWINKRSPSQREIIRLMIQLCEAVGAIHSASIIHRDLKPSNIIMDGRRPVIVDFGIATQGLSEQIPAGSPAFMAPEQRFGAGESTLADVYALGGVAYFLLTGKPPNEDGQPMPVNGCHLIKDARLRCVIERCLEHDPHARYPSPWMLANDLEAILHHKPVSVAPSRLLTRSMLFVRRRPVITMLMLMVVLGVAGLVQGLRMSADEIVELERLQAAAEVRDEYVRVALQRSILDLRMRTEIEPNYFWLLAELSGDHPDQEAWTYDQLTSPEGLDMLHAEVLKRTDSREESDIMLGFWWLLLARVQYAALEEWDEIEYSLNFCKLTFLRAIDEDDPLIGRIDRELERMRSSREQ